MSRHHHHRPSRAALWLAGAVLVASGSAQAASGVLALPNVATDDPSRVAPGGCQFEGWYQHDSGASARLSAPACNPAGQPQVQGNLGALTRAKLGTWGLGATAKFYDNAWRLGPARWGWKLSTYGQGLGPLDHVEHQYTSLLGLATITLPADLSLRVNVGPKHETQSRQTATQLNAALLWSLNDQFALAGEMQTSDRSNTVQSLGTNWWLVPGRVGMKLSAGRTIGNESSSVYSLQLNWHLLDRSRGR
ncbi:hypothetical protein [Caldimonas brevitalea]|uniref:Transporter n=1 Tax=Caldimonas brevitalea TaxID=413882 RepID=A0A0G3BWX5_9BURK|nr:hypothetical protein [Caldimonas brevitalea]AKJ31040.1 hypothetical protein AAW51_4349 [Caldimonas brevitalea]